MVQRRLCLFTILVTFVLILWGGVVHNTESSLACPDWPLCYGQFMPQMKGGILIEHGHRLLASLVGILTILLVVFTRKEAGETYKLAKLSLAFVIIQGLLGGITVVYKLPTIVSTSHLALSMIFFSTLILLYHKLVEKSSVATGEVDSLKQFWTPSLPVGLFLSGLLLYGQILLGAFMRHSGAGSACGLGANSYLLCWDKLSWGLVLWPSLAPAKLHMVHRYLGVVVAILLSFYSFKSIVVYRRGLGISRGVSGVKGTLFWMPLCLTIFLLCQILLGVATIFTRMSVIPTTAHLGMGALCLGVTWYFYLGVKSLERKLFGRNLPTLVSDLLLMTKPKLGLLVMATVLVGMVLSTIPGTSDQFFSALFALVAIWGVVGGASVLNCYLERDTDALMERTKDRGVSAGRVSPLRVLVFGTVLLSISTIALGVGVNVLTAAVSLFAALVYLFAYTPLKSKSLWAVYIGAVAGAIPPMLGQTAIVGSITPIAWCLFAILFVWQLPHFFAISIFYQDEYRAAGTKIYPTAMGTVTTVRLMVLFTSILAVVSLLPVYYGGASLHYRNSALVLGAFFILFSLRGPFICGDCKDLGPVRDWSRGYFWLSIFYLPILLGTMVFLK